MVRAAGIVVFQIETGVALRGVVYDVVCGRTPSCRDDALRAVLTNTVANNRVPYSAEEEKAGCTVVRDYVSAKCVRVSAVQREAVLSVPGRGVVAEIIVRGTQ